MVGTLVTADQLFAHAVGDYLLQTDRMAVRKTRFLRIAFAHALVYAVPFLLLCRPSWAAFAVMVVTHAIIDRYGLGRRLKSMQAGAPEALRIWLPIICDNILHVAINGAALKWL